MFISQKSRPGIRICVDRGGTFTDCIGFIPHTIHPSGETHAAGFRTIVVKLLSVDPAYTDAPREGIRRILELATGTSHPRNQVVEMIRMGTTVATNALLERKGEDCALLITKGFGDLLYIGNQSRPNIFDIEIKAPDVLYKHVIEVNERVTLVREHTPDCVRGITGEWVHILKEVDLKELEAQLKTLPPHIKSVAVCLMHSYTFNNHEILIKKLCEKLGFTHIALSSATSPMIKLVPRGTSTTADAYLTPSIQKYLEGFDKNINTPNGPSVEFMQSDGGLVPVNRFNGFKAILSGPAGGVVGYAMTSWERGGNGVIGFDMGGTSTDVSRFNGAYEHVFESITAGIPIQTPQLDINTVAAGGGSMLFFRNGMFVVGPESASAHPGPTCYRKSGPLTITDANLLLGRLVPDYFPKIFGKTEDQPLDQEASQRKFELLAVEINSYLKEKEQIDSNTVSDGDLSLDQVAYGFIKVANEAMCRPIRALTQGKGHAAKDHILACFGGAGGQHSFAIAKSLGINMILIHKHSSILSAYGLALADVVNEAQEPCAVDLNEETLLTIKPRLDSLVSSCREALQSQGFPLENITVEIYLNLRYQGTDNAIMTIKPDVGWDFTNKFVQNYQVEFGFVLPGRLIVIDDIRVRAIGKSPATGNPEHWTNVHQELKTLIRAPIESLSKISVYWESLGRVSTSLYQLNQLPIGTEITGPAIIIDATATIAIEPDCSAVITSEHIVGYVNEHKKSDIGTQMDPIMLSVFGHRFMSIAEQMGRTLQKTSVSTNIKERLDFSCALFGPDGGLVANAPHIPVHLGSMQEAVKWQMRNTEMKEGDVLLSNHPQAGGSHLPDITVITPVFSDGQVCFFVASRGHHADIGGVQPGSMPPNSTELYQEGAAIKSFKLVQGGLFDEIGIAHLLVDVPASFPGCSGTRCLRDNVSDLKAQVAANHKGIILIQSLINEYTLPVVQAYMGYIRTNAEIAVNNLLKSMHLKYGPTLKAVEYMDNGSPINLTIVINPECGTAVFDFEGTGSEVYGNINAPTSVTYSAIIYCLRCLINLDMPLNQGALNPITIAIPSGCFLNPSEEAAVVGGNVLTSQRLCDVIFKAFKSCAASQGCCNNFTFGRGGVDGWGYYETIGGGAGAGPTWNGRSGVHTHMTNTRITDPEILERRYPVLLHEFSLRRNSGGKGEFQGGEGLVRELEFLESIDISMLSERRVRAPYGMNGGEDGQMGKNILRRKVGDGYRNIDFGGKNSAKVKIGDRFRIETPGGGAWGSGESKGDIQTPIQVKKAGGSLLNFANTQNTG